jgi:hypothetical protein
VNGVVPSIIEGPGAALVSLRTGPFPPGPVAVAGGASQTFVWTFSASGSGAVTFTATAAGTTCGAVVVKKSDSASTTVQAPARLSARLRAAPWAVS